MWAWGNGVCGRDGGELTDEGTQWRAKGCALGAVGGHEQALAHKGFAARAASGTGGGRAVDIDVCDRVGDA